MTKKDKKQIRVIIEQLNKAFSDLNLILDNRDMSRSELEILDLALEQIGDGIETLQGQF